MMTDAFIECKYSRKEKLCWKFWDLIEKNCYRYRDVAFYANELNITPFYLSKITKGFMNGTPRA